MHSWMHLNKFGLYPDRLRAATFDGASNMSDHRDGTVSIHEEKGEVHPPLSQLQNPV